MAEAFAAMVALLATWLFAYLLHSTLFLGGTWASERLGLLRAHAAREFAWRAALVGGVLTASLQTAWSAASLPRPGFLPPAFTVELADAGRARGVEPMAAPEKMAAVQMSTARQAPAADHAPAIAQRRVAAQTPSAELTPTAAQALPPAQASTAAQAQTVTQAPTAAPAPAAAQVPTAAQAPAAARASVPTSAWPIILCACWIAAVALATSRLAALAFLARRELSGRRPVAGTPLSQRLHALCASRGLPVPRLSASARLASPICMANGEICVPSWVDATLTPAQQRALLAHELAHLQRRDPQWLLAALLLQALLPMQPLLALARRRIATLAELQADSWAARAVGDARSLAECLAECAERVMPDRAALFGAAITGRSSLVHRVQRLLEGTHMHTGTLSLRKRAGILAAAASMVLLVPVIVVQASGCSIGGDSSSVSISSDSAGSHSTIKVTRPGYALNATVGGAITYDDAETKVATMAAGASLDLSEKSAGVTRRVKCESSDGSAIVTTYWVDGNQVPMDAAGEAWMAKSIPSLLRATEDPKVRVARIMKRGGVDAVFTEIQAIEGNYNRSRYLAVLLAEPTLTDAQFDRAAQMVGTISSSFDRRNVLSAALAKSTDPARQLALLAAAKGISSDFDATELLVGAIPVLAPDQQVWDAWLAAAAGINSDFDMRRACTAVLQDSKAPAAAQSATLRMAASNIGSAFDLREVLASCACRAGSDPAMLQEYCAAVDRIHSDFDRREAIVALLAGAKLDAEGCAKVLEVIAPIKSDFDRGQALVAIAAKMPADQALIEKYRSVARTLSDFERGKAERALDRLAK